MGGSAELENTRERFKKHLLRVEYNSANLTWIHSTGVSSAHLQVLDEETEAQRG